MRKNPEGEDARYLALRRARWKIRDIAAAFNVSQRTVYRGIQAARNLERELQAVARAKAEAKANRNPGFELEPDYPANFGRLAPCPHDGPYPRGVRKVCEQCGQSGMDHHPALHRSSLTDPKPEPKPPTKPLTKPRKQSRKPKACAA